MCFLPGKSMAQCDLKFDFRIEEAMDNQDNGKIYIRLLGAEGNYTFKLFDWEDGKNEYTREIKISTLKKGEEILVFDQLKPSIYTVQAFDEKGCQTSIGGINKIVLSAKQ